MDEKKLFETIARRIRQARKQARLTQEEVAERMKLSSVGYGAFERGDRQISIEHLVALSTIFQKPITWFLGTPTELTDDEAELLENYRKAEPIQKELAQTVLKRIK